MQTFDSVFLAQLLYLQQNTNIHKKILYEA